MTNALPEQSGRVSKIDAELLFGLISLPYQPGTTPPEQPFDDTDIVNQDQHGQE